VKHVNTLLLMGDAKPLATLAHVVRQRVWVCVHKQDYLTENINTTSRREVHSHNMNTSLARCDDLQNNNVEDINGIWINSFPQVGDLVFTHWLKCSCAAHTNIVTLALSTWCGCRSKEHLVSEVTVETASKFVAAVCNTWMRNNITSCAAETLLQQVCKHKPSIRKKVCKKHTHVPHWAKTCRCAHWSIGGRWLNVRSQELAPSLVALWTQSWLRNLIKFIQVCVDEQPRVLSLMKQSSRQMGDMQTPPMAEPAAREYEADTEEYWVYGQGFTC
jgi:hypothetical protein